MSTRQGTQSMSWPNFQEHAARLVVQQGEALSKAHRLSQVARPITGIRRLHGRDPFSREVGDVGNARLSE